MRLDPDIAMELYDAAVAMTGTRTAPKGSHHERLQRALVAARGEAWQRGGYGT